MKNERISPFWVGGYHPFSADTDEKLFEVSRADFVRMVEDIIPVKRTFEVLTLNH